MSNRRLFYAVQQVGFARNGTNSFTSAHGLQSLSLNTKINLQQIFEIGQISLYSNPEITPDVEATVEKCLDGYPPVYTLATYPSTSPTLAGRSGTKTTMGLSVFTDTQDSASGTPLAQCTVSGLFVSAVSYDVKIEGPAIESVTLVGNNKIWLASGFTYTGAFNNTDAPSASEGVDLRQNIDFAVSRIPTDIPGISSSGTNDSVAGDFNAHLQGFKVGVNLGREQLFELGRRGPYHRYVQFPVEVKTDIEALSLKGDLISVDEFATSNVSQQQITLKMQEGLKVDCGNKNKLTSVSYGGANAGSKGGNATMTFSYLTYNDFTVTHPSDPSGL